MTIAEAREKCKSFVGRLSGRQASSVPRDIRVVAILVLASVFSFGLGYLAGRDAGQIGDGMTFEESLSTTATEGQVLASKNGTKYYLPWCAGADRIPDANKVWFASSDAAAEAGYTPAANCAGL